MTSSLCHRLTVLTISCQCRVFQQAALIGTDLSFFPKNQMLACIHDLARFCFPAPKLFEDQQTYFRFDITWTVHTQEYENTQILISL